MNQHATIERLAEYTKARLVPCADKREWLGERRLGGSSTPNLFGCGWSSEYAMWCDFMSPPEYRESTERFAIGLGLETFVCNHYQDKFGGVVEQWPVWTLARHPERDYMHATPDAMLFDDKLGNGPGSLSIKTWSEMDRRSWYDQETKEMVPPLYVQIQLQTELACLGWEWGAVAVLFGAQKLERCVVERNDYFIAQMYEACARFWSYVTAKIAPPIDESEASRVAWARLHPDDSGLAVVLPEEADQVMLNLEMAKDMAKKAEALSAASGNTLRSLIGDHTYGVSPEGRVYSLKAQDRKDKCCDACGAVVTPGITYRVLRSTKALPKGIAYVGEETATIYQVAERKQLPDWVKQRLFDDAPVCHWCGCQLLMTTATIEHLVPLSLGGSNQISNLSLACEPCNSARGDDATLTAAQIVALRKA